MSEVEFLRLVRTKAREYDEVKIYFTLKKMNFRFITTKTIQTIQVFLALRELGFKFVTVNLFSAITSMHPVNARALLHRLGDQKVLTLVRDKSRSFRYILSETFLWNYKTQDLNISSNLDSNAGSLRKGNGGVAPKQDEHMEVE